jgi:hypothetical protein
LGYQFGDGFDHYGDNYNLTNGYPWDSVVGSVNRTSLTDFRFAPPAGIPGGCLRFQSNSTGQWVRKNLGTFPGSSPNPATVFVLFGVKFLQLPNATGNFLVFFDTNLFQDMLTLNPNGALQFQRGNFVANIGPATPNGTIAANVWYGMAVAITVDPSNGSIQLFINGSSTPAISATGLNTRATANSQITQVAIGDSSNQIGQFEIRYDDFLCYDNLGGFLNALPGYDPRLFTKLPNQAGNYTNWTPNGLAANWQNAAVQPPSLANYNANNVGGTKDSYGMPPIGLITNPLVVIVRASLERDDAGPHTPNLLIRSGSTDGISAALPALASSYAFLDYVPQTDPNTTLAWTGPNADAAQPGVVEG